MDLRKFKPRGTLAQWLPLLLAATFAVGMWVGSAFLTRRGPWDANSKLAKIMELVRDNYVDVVNTDSLFDAAIPSLLAGLDPHSTYIPAEELQAVNDDLGGSFSGVGVQFTVMNDTVSVVEVIAGGPSEKVGLRAGDRIIAVGDSSAVGWDNAAVFRNLRGQKGSSVRLTVRRPGVAKNLTFNITRGDIPVNSVLAAYPLDERTGYMKINKFGTTTYNEFINKMVQFRGKGLNRFVIDLRGNGGGYMEPAVLMAQEFLPGGAPIVATRGRMTMNNQMLTSDGSGSFLNDELVVLMDEYSASASEIFAGAIQDNDRGLVIGRRSFGKGLVQNQMELPDNSAIRLTVARYYTPSGRCIQKTYAQGTVYENDIVDRYNHGEFYNADSIKFDKSLEFHTAAGRLVYGGGGIMPDIFVPNDTTGMTTYYLSVLNGGMLQRYAFDYTDRNRAQLSGAKTVEQLFQRLPSDFALLDDFVEYAARNGYTRRSGMIATSQGLILEALKSLIASNVLGNEAYYRVFNQNDPTVQRALRALDAGVATEMAHSSTGRPRK